MPMMKRKAVTDERPNKKVKGVKDENDGVPPKKLKNTRPTKSHDNENGEYRPAAKSVLQEEDRAFPRGGASVLTPIEHKQIKAQAERDVLFEQETGQKAPRADDDADDGALFDEGATSPPAKKKRKAKSKGGEASEKSAGSGIWVQGLSYKNLAVGSMVLGYVTAITGRDVALALPNNLTGYVPITAISQTLSTRIERLLAEDDGGEKQDDDVDMRLLFHVGQWLRAFIVSMGSEVAEGGKSKRRIELSIDPVQVNGGLDADGVVDKSMLQASVRSVEDHGIIMDLGLADTDIKGFVSKKELGSGNDLSRMQEGQVMMCLVTGRGSNGKVVKLSPDTAHFSAATNDKNAPIVGEAPTVDSFLPGTAVHVLVTDVSAGGVVGKIMGMLDVTADYVHAGAGQGVDMAKKYKIGSKIKGRIIWTIPGDDGARRVGFSTLDHALALPPPPGRLPENASAKVRTQANELAQHLPISSTVDDAKVTHVLTERGLFLSLPSKAGPPPTAFAHISQISDSRIDSLSSSTGAYKAESTHKARITSYNPVDNIYYVALKKSVLDQAFLRLEDLTVGALVHGKVERLILGGKSGITGVLLKLSDSITGLVPEVHLSDVQLQHPERKFREGLPIKARVLSVDLDKRHVRLTLKKTLLDSSHGTVTWTEYTKLEPGMHSQGTIIKLLTNGAVVQFFGSVRAWLPVAEMSDGFIESPVEHFRLGQTIDVRIVSVDPVAQEMKVSCKSSTVLDDEQQTIWDEMTGGAMVNGTVTEKSNDSINVDLESGLRGLIRIGHLADGPHVKADGALKRIRVGQKLTDLLVLDKLERSRQVLISNKSSLLQATQAGTLVRSFQDVKEGAKVHGFVRNVTPEGIYTEFTNGVVGLIPKSQVTSEMVGQPAFGLMKDQTVHAWVIGVDTTRQRFILSLREHNPHSTQAVAHSSMVRSDFSVGQVMKVHVASVKTTQINVRLTDDVQGRVDVSEIFDTWEDVTNKKAPLQKFKPNEELEVKILGIHDARNHRFLPISHRQSKVLVFELSAKRSRVKDDGDELLSLASVKAGGSYLAFVNNHSDDCVWVNLSPNVRGRIALMDLADDVGSLQRLEKNFPVGSALRVNVKSIDLATARLDLTAKIGDDVAALTLEDMLPGMVLPGRVTKVGERSVNVQLTDRLAGRVPLVELSDDFDQVNPAQYKKNDIVRVCVLDVDLPNKRVFLSLRPSKVLSSSLPVKDQQISGFTQMKPGDILRGFVKHVHDKGVIVCLGARIDAIVRVSDLSDDYVKDWKSIVEIDQLVKGRVVSVDAPTHSIQLSLKASHVNDNYTPPVSIGDLEPGMIITGKVRKVEDFGAFIDIDNTLPRLSGLCHRSEVAARRIQDVRKLYSAGDVVKAKILNVNVEARKISLGLKASYFSNVDEEEDDNDDDKEGSQRDSVELDGVNSDSDEAEDSDLDGGVDIQDLEDLGDDEGQAIQANSMDVDIDDEAPSRSVTGLTTTGFDWNGDEIGQGTTGAASDSEAETATVKKVKRNKAEIKVDMTGDLDKYGPRSVSDFERQLLGQPNDSGLWIQYMAFQLQLSEIDKARQLAERALRTINIREIEEKANIWIAWLNLEVEYGSEEQVDEVFKQACQVQDPLEMYQKLASIFIDSGKHDKADAMFERAVGNKAFRVSPDLWINYATFLLGTLKEADRARTLLPRALQSLPSNEHRAFTAKFAGLEFHSTGGDPERGRTIFEGLITEWPKWSTGWDTWVDLERSRLAHVGSAEAKQEAKEKARALFERMSTQKMKKRRAKFVFKRWLEFEEKDGDAKNAERVKVLAREYVEKLQARGEVEVDE